MEKRQNVGTKSLFTPIIYFYVYLLLQIDLVCALNTIKFFYICMDLFQSRSLDYIWF